MSCASETWIPTGVAPRTSLGPVRHDDTVARRCVNEADREIRHVTSGAHVTSRVVSDTTKANPEHIWGDEGPINE
jgi:hypothetical protein